MTQEEIGRMTVSELEQAASRVSAALSVLREAGAWRPADRPTAPEAAPDVEGECRLCGGSRRVGLGAGYPCPKCLEKGLIKPSAPPAILTPGPTVRFSPQEMAERARLLKQMRPELPDDIAALESA